MLQYICIPSFSSLYSLEVYMFVILLYKFLSVEYFDCPRIRQPIHQRNIVINFKEITSQDGKILLVAQKRVKLGCPLWPLGWPRKWKQLYPLFFKCGLVYNYTCTSIIISFINISIISFVNINNLLAPTDIFCSAHYALL